jgi:hypothetical protein
MVETNYRHNGMTLPKHYQVSIQRYVDKGISGGGFMDAVMANDLMKAFGRADTWSTELMPVITAYVYNRVPACCIGSWDVVDNWKGMEAYRKEQEQEAA